MKDIAIYGAGGFGREVACMLNRINREIEPTWNFIGFFDDGIAAGECNEYGKVLGNIDTLNSWNEPLAIVIAIGSPKIVKAIHDKIYNENIEFPNIISPDTVFLDRENVRMGQGNIICTRCIISCNVTIGNFNVLNCYIYVGHDSSLGNYNSIMPSVNISGGVTIGNSNFMGVNSVILQYKSIADNVIIGASSLVLHNIKESGTYIGTPTKKISPL